MLRRHASSTLYDVLLLLLGSLHTLTIKGECVYISNITGLVWLRKPLQSAVRKRTAVNRARVDERKEAKGHTTFIALNITS